MKTSFKLFALISLLAITILSDSCSKAGTTAPTCVSANSLSLLRSSTNTANLRWTGGNAAPYTIQYRVVGTTAWLSAASVTDSIQLTGLTVSTNYEWQVKNTCMTAFSTSATFTTAGCDPGYEGPDCATQTRTKYTGTYIVSETKNGGTAYQNTSVVTAGATDVTQVLITNLGGNFYNNNVRANVNSTGITIPSQDPDGDGYIIVGSGAINGTTISLSYTITGLNAAQPPVTVTDHYVTTMTR